MATPDFILFPGDGQWRVAQCDGGPPRWSAVPIARETESTGVATAVAAHLRELAYGGRPVVLAMASADCLAVRIATTGLPRGDRRALAYRLEEQVPLAAEDVTADFAPAGVDGGTLAGCVRTARLLPLVAALEAAGVAVGPVVAAAIAAAQACTADQGVEDAVTWLLPEPLAAGIAADGRPARISAVTVRAGRPVDWAVLPMDVADVRLHLGLLSGELQTSPRLAAAGVDAAFADALSAALGRVVRSRAGPADDAAATFAVGVLAGREKPWFDFRRDALAATDRLRQFRGGLNAVLAAAAAALLALTVVLAVQAGRCARAEADSRADAAAAFRQRFPGWATPADVRAVIAAERRRAAAATAEPAAGGAAYGTAMTTLRDVLAGLPAGGRFALDSLSVQDASLAMAGRLASFEQADALAAAARKAGLDVPPPQTRRAAGGTWAFVLQGTRPGDVAGRGGAGP